MDHVKDNSYSPIEYRRVTVSFIYSFLLSIPNFEEFGKVLVSKGGWTTDPPKSRRGLVPGIRLSTALWKCEVSRSVSLFNSTKADLKATLESIWRISENGGCTITLSLTLGNTSAPPTIADIYLTLALIQRTYDDLVLTNIRTDVGSEVKTLFELFSEQAHDLLSKARDSGAQLSDVVHQKADLDSDEWQVPYVVTVCDVTHDGNNSTWWGSGPPSKELHALTLRWKEVATILLRLVDGENYLDPADLAHVRIPPCSDVPGVDMSNYAWNDKLYIGFHPRSAILICNDQEIRPSSFMIPSLIDLCEVIRIAWHTGIVLNASLDRIICSIQVKEAIPLDVLQQIIELRKLWALHLNDPSVYRFDGGSVTAVARVARDTMQLNHFEHLTSRKFEVLDSLCTDQMRVHRINQYFELADISQPHLGTGNASDG